MKLTAKALEAAKAAQAIAEAAVAAGRELDETERETVKAHLAVIESEKAIAAKAEESADLLASVKALGDLEVVTGAAADAVNAKALAGARTGIASPRKSAADQVLASAQLKAFAQRYPNGVGEKARVDVDPIMVGGMKAVIGSTLVPGFTPVDNQVSAFPDALNMFARPLTLRDLVTLGTTGSDTVEFARLNTATNAAAPVAQASGTSGGVTGGDVAGTKPESALVWAKTTVTVKTIAHWLAATTRSLSDAGQLRTLIDQFLRYGLEEELEDQMLTGSGTGENLMGILNTSGIQTQAFATDIPTSVRKGITKLKTTGKVNPTAVLMNPADAEVLDLMKDSSNRYLGSGPFTVGQRTLWGLPIVESEAQTAGFATVGDFRQAVLWDREQATISATNSHADFFTRNLVAILGELRAAFGVIRPLAFCSVDIAA